MPDKLRRIQPSDPARNACPLYASTVIAARPRFMQPLEKEILIFDF
jgi:hypothetical protein